MPIDRGIHVSAGVLHQLSLDPMRIAFMLAFTSPGPEAKLLVPSGSGSGASSGGLKRLVRDLLSVFTLKLAADLARQFNRAGTFGCSGSE